MTQSHQEKALFAKTILLLAVALTFAWAGSSAARPPRPHGPGPGPATFPDQLLEEVGVSQSTREQIAAVSKESEAQAKGLHDKIHADRESLRELLEQDSPNSDEVMKKVDEIGALEIEADKHRLSTMLAIRALLTPEQRAQLMKLHDQHRGKRFGRKMRKVERACQETLQGVCSEAQGGKDRMECLHDNIADTSESCQKAMRKAHRPRHPRLNDLPQDSAPKD